jgi:lipid-A-disaccharide synthase
MLNLPEMLAAARMLNGDGQHGRFEFVVPVASTLDESWLRQQLSPAEVEVHLAHNAQATLKHSRAAIVASGTATVEAALAGTPFVVVYRLAPLTWLLGRRLVTLDTFAMPNLIAGRRIVPELIQKDFTAAGVVRELNAIIRDGSAREKMLSDLEEIRTKLLAGGHSEAPAQRAAREIVALLR